MESKKMLFIGIDLNNARAMVSLFLEGMEQPETVSTVPGEERYSIPTAVYCDEEGKYFYGDEAVKRQDNPDGTFFDNIYRESLASENVIYRGILAKFMRRLIQFSQRYDDYEPELYLSVTVPEINDASVKLMRAMQDELGFPTERFQLMDYGESFFAFVYHQDPAIYRHDVAMFDFDTERITFRLIHADVLGEIKRVASVKKQWNFPEYLTGHNTDMDRFFSHIVRDSFEKNIISGVYLVGDGFDGDWMKDTYRMIGPNKRVFKGKNLYSVGACLAAWRNVYTEGWIYYYDCDYKLQGEISLEVIKDGRTQFVRMTMLGENWFAPTPTFYCLFDGNADFTTRTRVRQRMNARKDVFTLDLVPERAPGSIRFGVQAVPVNGREVVLRIWDDGFGDLYETSGKVWEFPIIM